MPNIERLTALLEYVEKLPPERIRMENYFCSTAACLVGHATILFKFEYEHEIVAWSLKFFDLTPGQWTTVFNGDIPNEYAVQNLRDHIERWSNAQY